MSSIISFTSKELKKLTADKKSCVEAQKVTLQLGLQPWCLVNVEESLRKNLDDKIGKFDKDIDGILLSYKNLQMLQEYGAIRNDKTEIFFKIQADYYVFRPSVGATLKGIVNKKSPHHLGVLVHRVFSVVIPCPSQSSGEMWVGRRVKEGQEVIFKIVVLDLFGALPYIRGELLEKYLNVDEEDSVEELYFESVNNVSHVHIKYTKPQPSKIEDNKDRLELGSGQKQKSESEVNELKDSDDTSTSTTSKTKKSSKKKKRKHESDSDSTEHKHKKSSKKKKKD